MEDVIIAIALITLGAASWFWAADSRPGIDDTWNDRRQPWYPHS